METATETVDLERRALTLPEQATDLVIASAADFEAAGDLLTRIKGLRAEIGEAFDPIIKKAHEAHKEACAQKNRIEAPLVRAECIIKPKVAEYFRLKEQERRAEEARLLAEQRKTEEDARVDEAASLEAAGEPEMAERVLNEPSTAAPIILPRATPKVQGVSIRAIWKGRFDDLDKVIKAAAGGDRVARSLLLGNQSALDGLARSMRENFRVPGCRAFAEGSVAAGARR